MFERTCGKCTACCLTHAVVEIDKKEGVLCSLCDPRKGCQDYDNRPSSCGSFSCDFLRGFGDITCRPDRVGVVRDSVETSLGLTLQLWEVEKGSLAPSVNYFEAVEKILRNNQFVVCFFLDGRRILYSPPNYVPLRKHLGAMLRDGVIFVSWLQFCAQMKESRKEIKKKNRR